MLEAIPGLSKLRDHFSRERRWDDQVDQALAGVYAQFKEFKGARRD